MQYNGIMLPGLVTCCIVTAFCSMLLKKDREKDISDGKTRKKM